MNYRKEIEALMERIEVLQATKKDMCQSWAEHHAPTRPGRIMRVTEPIFTGKVMEVITVEPIVSGPVLMEWYWQATGWLIRRDGTPGRELQVWQRLIRPEEEGED